MDKDLINPSQIGLRIRHFRKQMHMTQEAFASSINISKSYLALIESGKRTASIDVLAQIAYVYNLSVDHLLFGHQEINEQSLFKKWNHLVKNRTLTEIEASLELLECYFRINDKYNQK